MGTTVIAASQNYQSMDCCRAGLWKDRVYHHWTNKTQRASDNDLNNSILPLSNRKECEADQPQQWKCSHKNGTARNIVTLTRQSKNGRIKGPQQLIHDLRTSPCRRMLNNSHIPTPPNVHTRKGSSTQHRTTTSKNCHMKKCKHLVHAAHMWIIAAPQTFFPKGVLSSTSSGVVSAI